MGKITVNLPDELEKRLRAYIASVYSGEKLHGKLSDLVSKAIEEWLERNTASKERGGEE